MEEPMELEEDTVPNAEIIETKALSVASAHTNNTTPDKTVNQNENATEHEGSSNQDIVIIDNDDSDDQTEPAKEATISKNEDKMDDIVVLDDEDEDPKEQPCDVIDLVAKKQVTANTKCINYACNGGKDMIAAPLFCLTYYRVNNTEKKHREVCQECYDIAMQFYDQLAHTAITGGNLFDVTVPLRNDLVEIDDSDSEDETDKRKEEYFSQETVQYINDNINSILEDTVNKYGFHKQMDNGIEFLKEKAKTVKSNICINTKRLFVNTLNFQIPSKKLTE